MRKKIHQLCDSSANPNRVFLNGLDRRRGHWFGGVNRKYSIFCEAEDVDSISYLSNTVLVTSGYITRDDTLLQAIMK